MAVVLAVVHHQRMQEPKKWSFSRAENGADREPGRIGIGTEDSSIWKGYASGLARIKAYGSSMFTIVYVDVDPTFVFRIKTGTTNDLEAVVKLRCFVVHYLDSQEGNHYRWSLSVRIVSEIRCTVALCLSQSTFTKSHSKNDTSIDYI